MKWWKNKSIEEKSDWVHKMFLIVLIILLINGVFEIFRGIVTLMAYGLI